MSLKNPQYKDFNADIYFSTFGRCKPDSDSRLIEEHKQYPVEKNKKKIMIQKTQKGLTGGWVGFSILLRAPRRCEEVMIDSLFNFFALLEK